MPKTFRLFAYFFMACAAFLFSCSDHRSGTSTDGFRWTLYNGKIILVNYEGEGTKVRIPDEIEGYPVDEIKDSCLGGASHLEHVTVGKNVTRLDRGVFLNLPALSAIDVDPSNGRFSSRDGVLFDKTASTLLYYPRARNADSYSIPSSVTAVGDSAFSRSRLVSIVIPDSVASIGSTAFWYCERLVSVVVPGPVPAVEDQSFRGCSSLVSISLPASVTSIGELAFYDCGRLASISLPASLVSIGRRAFNGCERLASISLPASVAVVDQSVFQSCPRLRSISVDPKNEKFSSIDGVLFDKGGAELVAYPLGRKAAAYSIPASVVSIRDEAFCECGALVSVDIPASVAAVGEEAFCYCPRLRSISVDPKNEKYSSVDGVLFDKAGVTLIAYPPQRKAAAYSVPAAVTSIANSAFAGCAGLAAVELPASLASIGDFAFTQCAALASIRIPSSVASVGMGAFRYCGRLAAVNVERGSPAALATLEDLSGFEGNKPGRIIYVPAADVAAYQKAEHWSEYADSIRPAP